MSVTVASRTTVKGQTSVGGFSPASLFLNNEQGVWYDPSDMTTMFQDAAGTTPVTAVEQPVGLIRDKSGRGNHASQSTADNRPILSARVNYIRNSTTPWTQTSSGFTGLTLTSQGTYGPDGVTPVYKSVVTSSGSISYCYSNPDTGLPLSANTVYKITQRVKTTPNDYQFALIKIAFTGVVRYAVLFNVSTGAFIREYTVGTINNKSYSATYLGDDWWELSIQASTTPTISSAEWGFLPIPTSNPALNTDFDLTDRGDNIKGVLLGGSGIQIANQGVNLPTYQRVNTSSDYDTTNFPMYLKFDGSNDYLVGSDANMPTGDLSIFSGSYTNTDSYGALISYGKAISGNSVALAYGPAAISYLLGASQYGSFSGISNSINKTFVFSVNRTGNNYSYRRNNGSSVSSDTMTSSTSVYGNNGLTIGSNNEAQSYNLKFNGYIYGLIIRGASSNALQIAGAENWLNQKTKAYA